MDFKHLNYVQIIELAHNRSYEEICNMTILLKESIRQYFSRLLMDTDAENPKQCWYILDTPESVGLSDALKPTLVSMYQDPSEGYIYFLFEGCEEYESFDYYDISVLFDILSAIEREK